MFKRFKVRFLAFLSEQVAGLLNLLRLVLIVFSPIAAGIYGGLIGSDFAVYVWGIKHPPSDMFVHLLIAGLFACCGFYGVGYLLRLVGIDR